MLLKNKQKVYVNDHQDLIFYGEVCGVVYFSLNPNGKSYLIRILDKNECKGLENYEYDCILVSERDLQVA